MKNKKGTIGEQLMAMADAAKAVGNLSGMNLTSGVGNLSGINLTGVNLKGVNLKGVNLVNANLKGADPDLLMPSRPTSPSLPHSSWGWLMLWRRKLDGKMKTYLILFALLFSPSAFGQVIVVKPSKTGAQQESIYRTLDFITANMDAQCSTTLPMAKDMITALESDRKNEQTILIGHGTFVGTNIAAFTGATKDTVGYLIVIADNGAFFTANEQTESALSTSNELGTTFGGGPKTTFYLIAKQYKGGSNQAKVEILLHELGHAVNAPGFVDDYGSPVKVDSNDDIVMRGCKSILKAAGKFKGVL